MPHHRWALRILDLDPGRDWPDMPVQSVGRERATDGLISVEGIELEEPQDDRRFFAV
jgi:hypothetical protein